MCKCGCGLPVSDAYRDQTFIVDTFTCHADRALKMARRKDDEKAKAENKPEGWNDGRHYYVKPYEPEEKPRGD